MDALLCNGDTDAGARDAAQMMLEVCLYL